MMMMTSAHHPNRHTTDLCALSSTSSRNRKIGREWSEDEITTSLRYALCGREKKSNGREKKHTHRQTFFYFFIIEANKE